ncbi:uncharacterized protein LOC112592747 [Melanaphis sacchari]|uniref:uncharacterized protein LOC112592747 n=1 Tax=Melanaphis sacchari TaxID=742174 RepID=UPI000DC146C8|nr:uncharacterized protein LOC112592747 [Melanaphis sacchari]
MVATKSQKFNNAKVVLQHLLYTINIIEQIVARKFCLSYSYVAVSQYHLILMEFDEAWSWAVKAVLELQEDNQTLKVMVLSHAVKVACIKDKLYIAKLFGKQLITYTPTNIRDNIHIDLLRNEGFYYSVIDCPNYANKRYYKALDLTRNLYGYYNLNTALVLVDYAFVCSKFDIVDYLDKNNESMRCVLQAIFIMKTVGVPEDNMLLKNAYMIKARILGETAIYMNLSNDIDGLLAQRKRVLLQEASAFYSDGLKSIIQSVGENSLLAANAYMSIGVHFMFHDKFFLSEEFNKKANAIYKSILGENHFRFAVSLDCLNENINDTPYIQLRDNLENLIYIYTTLENEEKISEFSDYCERVNSSFEDWLDVFNSELINIDCTKDNLSMEKFKCILNGCNCVQQ